MPTLARFGVLFFCLLPSAASFAAQTTPAKKTPKPAAKREATDPLAEARRITAISLVSSLADEARSFRDELLRARVQARAADALWDTDKAKSRLLFRRAWEAAEAADQEGRRKFEEARRRTDADAGRAQAVARSRPSMRREVLRLAARRDRDLGEEFLARLEEARKQESADASGAAASGRFNPDNPPPNVEQRVSVARQLLEEGEVERALQFAGPALYPVNVHGIDFLIRLREKSREAADARFASLLAEAANDPASDANTVSLLSSYVFTPYLYLVFQPSGDGHTRQWSDRVTPPADMSPQLRASFLRAAASILLRPLPPVEEDRTTSGRGGAYVVTARMIPLFEQHAPDQAAALRERLAQLQQDTRESVRRPDNRALTEGIVPPDPNQDFVREILERAEKMPEGAQRDEGYVQAAFAAMRGKNDHALARELVDKVSDLDLRKQARAFLDFAAASEAVRAKKHEEAYRLARAGEMTPTQRTWIITEAARLLAKSEPGRALAWLEEASAEARRIDASSPDRVRALVGVATQLFALDRPRAWELMSEVVKAGNAAQEFTGEDAQMMVRVQFRRGASTMNFTAESFDVTGLFAALARDDFNRAVELARNFAGEAPRAAATLAAARTALLSGK